MKRDQIERLKHNAKLDVRLPDQLKDEFLARCRAEGVSSGAVIRSLIIDYVTKQPRPWMARCKEVLVRRSKWMLGGIGASAITAMSTVGVVFAPVASADTVNLDVALAIDDGVERTTFDVTHETTLGEGWMVFPTNEAGEASYAMTVFVRACEDTDLQPDSGCDVVFSIEVFEVLKFHENELGGVSVTDKRVVATPVITGQFGETMSYIATIEEGESTVSLTTRAVVSDH